MSDTEKPQTPPPQQQEGDEAPPADQRGLQGHVPAARAGEARPAARRRRRGDGKWVHLGSRTSRGRLNGY